MDKQLSDNLANSLKQELKTRFVLSDDEIQSISSAGQNSLTAGMKHYVLKNGSSEIENILLGKSLYVQSGLRKALMPQLSKDLMHAQNMDSEKANSISEFAGDFLVKAITDAFQNSNFSKDTDGICGFIGIDKNLLKMVNSPAGKFFGKFF